jgi:hypothetical protein
MTPAEEECESVPTITLDTRLSCFNNATETHPGYDAKYATCRENGKKRIAACACGKGQ